MTQFNSFTETTNYDFQLFDDAMKCNTNKIKNYINKKNSFNIDSSPQFDKYKSTLLHIATETNNYDLVQYLLFKNANYNLKNGYGKTQWDLALLHGNNKIIDLYLSKKEEIKNNELKKLKSDNNFYCTRLQSQKKNYQTLESINSELTYANKNLSLKLKKETDNLKREKRKYTVLESSLNLETKKRKKLEIENNELLTKNKRLKISVENLSNSLRN